MAEEPAGNRGECCMGTGRAAAAARCRTCLLSPTATRRPNHCKAGFRALEWPSLSARTGSAPSQTLAMGPVAIWPSSTLHYRCGGSAGITTGFPNYPAPARGPAPSVGIVRAPDDGTNPIASSKCRFGCGGPAKNLSRAAVRAIADGRRLGRLLGILAGVVRSVPGKRKAAVWWCWARPFPGVMLFGEVDGLCCFCILAVQAGDVRVRAAIILGLFLGDAVLHGRPGHRATRIVRKRGACGRQTQRQRD